MRQITKALLGAAALVCVAPTSANAATFVLNNTGGAAVGTAARAGFDAAARYWSQVLTDNVTINLNIGFGDLGPGILGGASSSLVGVTVGSTYGALAFDASSTLDAAAVASLRPLTPGGAFGGGSLTVVANDFAAGSTTGQYSDQATRIDADGSANNSAIAMNTTVFKALGGVRPAGSIDGNITFANAFASLFDFDPTDGIGAGQLDFVGVAVHEIGHTLGFRSGVDVYDSRTINVAGGGPAGSLEGSVFATQLDLFRYGAPGVLDWSTSASPKYFSIDGGVTQLFGDSRFAMGVTNGDGRQASHWKDKGGCSGQIGIMDPNFCAGQMGDVTASDLAAFDAIGWGLYNDILLNPNYHATSRGIFTAFQTAVPEPATWAMMIAGFGMVGGTMRRASRRKSGLAALA